MLQPKTHQYISESDYLEGEKISEVKHELIDGEVYAMAGASFNHNLLITNISRLCSTHLLDSSCFTFTSDMKVRANHNFYYPDVVVSCDDDSSQDEYYRESPILIVEVLSKSTRQIDKSVKIRDYCQIPSLQEYVLIEQDFADVEILRKSNGWRSEHYFLGDDVTFGAIELTVSVEEIYRRVNNSDVLDWLQQQKEQSSTP